MVKKGLLAWGVFKRDGEFLAAYPQRSEAREMACAEAFVDFAGKKAVVKRISLKIYAK